MKTLSKLQHWLRSHLNYRKPQESKLDLVKSAIKLEKKAKTNYFFQFYGKVWQNYFVEFLILKIRWQRSLGNCRETEMKAYIRGAMVHMAVFDFLFLFVLEELILQHIHDHNKTLQAVCLSARRNRKKVPTTTIRTLSENVPINEDFYLFCKEVWEITSDMKINNRELLRKKASNWLNKRFA